MRPKMRSLRWWVPVFGVLAVLASAGVADLATQEPPPEPYCKRRIVTKNPDGTYRCAVPCCMACYCCGCGPRPDPKPAPK